MGLAIDREQFDAAEYQRFSRRLEECLAALERLLARPGFGAGPATVGAELKLFLVDGRGRALPRNQAVRDEAADPWVVLEIDRFNLELNLTPAPLAGRPFAAFASGLEQALSIVALNNGIRRLRQEPFRIRIDGADPLELAADDVGLEGANTSFQVHLRVDPERFASTFNAAQLTTGPALAVAGNSPTFLGHRLWEETRVALFKQAVDDRDAAGRSSRRVARVAFGTGWTTPGASELLEESARLHEPVLPCSVPSARWSWSRRDGCPPWTSCACTRGRSGAGTGPSTTRPPAATCGSSCAPCPPAPPWSTCWPTPPSCSA
jgi:hypothetical protein